METKTQHTPTPWSFVDTNMQTKDGVEVHRWFNAGGLPLPLTDANAAFIVRAVNSHEDMLDVIKRAKRVVAESCGYNDGVRFHTDLLRDIESAIAQAEGE